MNLNATAPATPAARPQLTGEQFAKFSSIIYDTAGIRFQENKNYFLASKILERCNVIGIDGADAYFDYLHSASGRSEYGHFIDAITINETFFYRNQPQLQAFETEVLSHLVNKRRQEGKHRLRIWSCASSTGDEIYTIALIIKACSFVSDMQIELVGTDICHDALLKAREGAYSQYATRNIPQNLLQQYFKEDATNRSWLLSDEIKNMVRFGECNLMEGNRIASLGKFDIILCRNVLIYFDEKSKDTVVQNLANALEPDGFVLLGHSENIYIQRHILRPDKERSASLAYVKAPPGTERLNV